MKKLNLAAILIITLMCSCNPRNNQHSTDRSDIVNWAIKIVEIESDYKEITDKFNILQRKMNSDFPTNDDMSELEFIYETIAGFYTKLNDLTPPSVASSVHRKFKEQYSLASSAILQYYISIGQNDITYYEKSVINSKEANRIGDEASDDFIELLINNSISCSEIGLCD